MFYVTDDIFYIYSSFALQAFLVAVTLSDKNIIIAANFETFEFEANLMHSRTFGFTYQKFYPFPVLQIIKSTIFINSH